MEDRSCKTSRWRFIKNQLNNLSAEAFRAEIYNNSNALIVDVRTRQEYLQGHLPSAIHINYLSQTLWFELNQLPKDRDCFIYCRSGRRSIRVCTLMKNGGFDHNKIFNLSLGLVDFVERFPNELTNDCFEDIDAISRDE